MKRLPSALMLCILVISACSSKTETNFDTGIRDKVLYIGNGHDPLSLDPSVSTGMPEYHIQLALFEGLVTKDNKTLELEPAVAKSWEISEDGMQYTFTLREDARWSNGDTVTAHDFVNSYRRALAPEMANQYAYMLYYLKNGEAFSKQKISDFSHVGVKATSDFELVIHLQNPTPYFLQLLDHHTYYPVHKPSIEKVGGFLDLNNPWTRPENFVGNGPFTLDVWDVNRAVELKRNEFYWDQDRIHLNRIVFYPIEEKSAEDRAFRSGQIHLTHTPQFSPEKIAVYREKNPEALRLFTSYSIYYYNINMTKAPFNNVDVRQALALSIDRESIVKSVTKGGEEPAYSVIPHDPQGYSPKTLFSYDVEKAKAHLAKAGYPNGEGFPSFEILYNNDDLHRKVALTIQQMWKKNLNIDVGLINQEWKVYLNSEKTRNYDVSRAGWVADYLDPSTFLEIFQSFSGINYPGYNNPQYDIAVKNSQQTLDQAERFKQFDIANKLLVEDMPAIPLFYYSETNLVAPEVIGWHDDVMNYQNFKDVDLAKKPE